MKKDLQYINYYNLALLKGSFKNMRQTSNYTLQICGDAAVYIAPMLDTGELECDYNRLIVEGNFDGAKLEVYVGATDHDIAVFDDQPQSLRARLENFDFPIEEKIEILQNLSFVRKVNTQDILLHDIKGRYAFVMIVAYSGDSQATELKGLRLEFHKYSFVEYFPEIYQGNSFFEKYLAIFQSNFLDIEKEVDKIPTLLDYETTDDLNIDFLASWVGIDNTKKIYSPAQLKYIIKNLDLFQASKGSKRAMQEAICLVSGTQPVIIEYFEWAKKEYSQANQKRYKELYGENSSSFCVMLDNMNAEKTDSAEDDVIRHVIDEYSVFGTTYKLINLTHTSHMDTHCYLDVNCRLSVPQVASVDNNTIGSHLIIG